ncbi:MAG: family 10 glycosylhydrolase [Muribaculaceae bacterium]|nr:family 10 glycosylhydrolase [Muribaculaceae bacterium]
MKRKFLNLTLIALALILAIPVQAATTPKREHRSAWISTVWRLCWPTTYGTGTSVAASQKAEALSIIEKMHECNFNALYFQVRGMSDAMYNSSYEPWSSYLTETRGSAPSYDPLEYWVTECHKRGMECYAWINPYRYESSAGTWGTADYRKNNPDWLLTYGSNVILNPGLEEVQQRIVDICKEIITNYDVDGIVFDDYFYSSGTPTGSGYDYDLWKSSGSSLSQADWRRENVNTMVRKVYNMIQSTKPYVKFGIAPAGVAYKSASKYGISTSLVSGMSDWQYDGIYSDPLAWLNEGTIDFISPQCYWETYHSTNPYEKLINWWSDVCANVFGRHFYSSQNLEPIGETNTTTFWSEIATQVQLNRDYDGLNAPGAVLFDSRYFSSKYQGLAEYLLANKFQNKALQPTMTWKSASDPGVVTNMALSGTTLSWTGVDNMRYAVYAVPNGITPGTDISSEYLIGNPYSTTFDVSGYTSGYQLGVSIVDRHSNEYTVTWLGSGSTIEQLEQVTIHTPTDGSTTAETFDFTWDAIDGATYTLEISTSSSFSTVNFSKTTTSTTVSSTSFNLATGTKYYWRVKAAKDGYVGSTSWVGSFTTYNSGSSSGSTTTLTKDPATYNSINNFSIESLWIYSVNTSNFPSQLGGDQRSMTAYNGNLYIIHRDGYIYEFSGETGEYLRSITLSGDYATSSSGTSLGYKCNDIFVDGAGNLCISNMTLNSSTAPLTVCTVNLSTGVATRVFEATHSNATRIDYAATFGDVTSTGGQVWAAAANSNYVYRWTRNSSGTWTAAYTSIGSYYTNAGTEATNNSTAPRIMPISSTQFVLDGHNSAPTLYTFNASGTATLNDSFANNTSIAPTADNWNGLCTGTVADKPIFAYVSAIAPTSFNVVHNPSNFNFSAMEELWTVPSAGLGSEANGYVSAQPATISNSDGSMTLFVYSPNNGIAAYKLAYSGTTDTPDEDLVAVTLSAPSNGATTTSGFEFAWSEIEGATYTLEIATNTTFTSGIMSATTTATSFSSNNFTLSDGTTYYWRVKAAKDGYNSSTSATYSFKTASPNLDAVTLTSPSAGATVANGFNFSWSTISGATYTLEISKSSTFSSVDFSATTTATSYSSNNFSLAPNTTYYWRVKAAVSGYNSSTTAAQAFTTPMEALSTVTLYSPIGGATVGESFDFSWSAISGATYTLELSVVATFASVMQTIETSSNSYSSSNLSLNEGAKYYWRVTASKSGYSSSTSAIESFVTPTTTIDPGPTTNQPDGGTYDVISDLKIENLWISSNATSNLHEQLGRDQRGMATLNGKVYISERANGAGYLLEFDGETGTYLRTIALTGDYLTLSNGYSLGYPCNDVFVDGGGHLCISNMATSFSTSGQMTICTVDINTGATTRMFESSISSISIRMDHCMVYGDITQAGARVYGAAASASSYSTSSSTRPQRPGQSTSTYDYRKRIYCWTRNSSGTWSVVYRDANSYYPASASSFGSAPRVMPIDDTRIIVDGSESYPTLYSYGSSSAIVSDNFDSNTAIKPDGMLGAGMCTGEVAGKPLYIYAYNDNSASFFDFAIVHNPDNFNFSTMEILWKVPQYGLGNSSNPYFGAIPAIQNNADGSLTLYIYVPNNGLAAYRISDATLTGNSEIEIEETYSVKVINRVATLSNTAEIVNIYSTAGVLVATANNCKSINLKALPCGIYIIEAQNKGNTITERIVIK